MSDAIVPQGELVVTVSRRADEFRERVRAFEQDPVNRKANAYMPVDERDRASADELVDRGVAFYSLDRDHIGLLRPAHGLTRS